MKINGSNDTFAYNSSLWLNKKPYQANNVDLDNEEAKLASFWTLPFTELRLGMKIAGATRWITISYNAPSLYSVLVDGRYRATNIGKRRWRSLLPESSMQTNCNKVYVLQ